MGRPIRVYMAPSSPVNWLPRGRGPDQQIVASMSRLSAPDIGDVLGDDDPPPQPSYARRQMLMAATRGLGKVKAATAGRLLRKILTSPLSELRTVAVEALAVGGLTVAVRARLHEALGDEAAPVRAAAARAFLRHGVADEAQRDPGARARLHAHVAIARQDWAAVEKLGTAALPALAATTHDPDTAIRREAHWVAAHLIRRHARAVSRETSPTTGRVFASTRARDGRRLPA
jgi:HEAT repeat protein